MKKRGVVDWEYVEYIVLAIFAIVGLLVITGQGPAALRMLSDLAAKAGEAGRKGTTDVIKDTLKGVIIPGA